MDTITRRAEMFPASLVHFDAIPISWASKHYCIGLILLQHRCIPKFLVNVSAVIITTLALQCCSFTGAHRCIPKSSDCRPTFFNLSTFMTPNPPLPPATIGYPLTPTLIIESMFISCIHPLISVNFCDFLTLTDTVTDNPQKYLAAETYY
jgi:hypothetical protein